MFTLKLYTSTGKFIGFTTVEDIEDALELVKGHITNNDTIVVISDTDYIEGIQIL